MNRFHRNEEFYRDEVEYLEAKCLDAIGQVDDEAKKGPKNLPEHVQHACAHAASMSATSGSLDSLEARHRLFLGMLALLPNLWRAGYWAGRRDAIAQLETGEG